MGLQAALSAVIAEVERDPALRLSPGMLERLAGAAPATLACMHGSAWRGDGALLLRALR